MRARVRGEPGGSPQRPLAGWLSGLPAIGPRRSAGVDLRGVRAALARWPAARLCAVYRDHGVSAGRWKRAEREVAAALGGRRLPNSGTGQPDVRLPGFALQIKTRRELPAWLWAAVDQATRDADPGELPAVVLNQVSQGRRARRLVVLDFERFAALIAGEMINNSQQPTGSVPDPAGDPPPPGRLVWPVVEPPECPPCEPRYSIGMLFPASAPWAAADAGDETTNNSQQQPTTGGTTP
ncbi:MAG: hypothetical protein M3Q71_06570 [Chloroflexota bacterium]|nr:hypothetical protein [Chloroflexota bacterium]